MVTTPIEYRSSNENGYAAVGLAGDWNDWSPVPMQQLDSKTWALTVDLASGSHQFKFVADGTWVTNPLYDTIDDGHAGKNNICLVEDDEDLKDNTIGVDIAEGSQSDTETVVPDIKSGDTRECVIV